MSEHRLDPRAAVLIGVGTSASDDEAVTLMGEALVSAGLDSGSSRTLTSIDRIAVPQGSWKYADPARLAAHLAGVPSAESRLVELGIPQQSLISDALTAISEGRSEVAAVVGGEAKHWARDRERQQLDSEPSNTSSEPPDVIQHRLGPIVEDVEVAHRLWDPIQQYAMIDNALRAADGLTIDEQRLVTAELWARFNTVARSNPAAAFPAPMEAGEIAAPSPTNRPLAFPYNKWHSTQWTVNQSAALIFSSVEMAERLGVPRDRWVFPLVGLESGHAVSLLRRAEMHRWPAMEVLGQAASRRIGRPLNEIDVIELYSCFPAAVRVQQRALGLDPMSTPTITGGMAFAGGPFNNFVFQAMVAVIAALRDDPSALGMVTTVSGLLTKPGIGIWSGRPDGHPPLLADMKEAAGAATGVIEAVATLDGYEGPATIATATATYDGMDPVRTVALCDTADGRRSVAMSEDRSLARAVTREELAGRPVHLGGGTLDLA
jgi:acetyl-CoA C-acetyltransferase